MTTYEINRRIAEAIGWREAFPALKEPHPLTKRPGIMLPYHWINERTNERAMDLPDFARDLNEMHDAENVLMDTDNQGWNRYVDFLFERCADGTTNDPDFGALLNTSAALRAEAFLRAIGRWE